MSKRTSDRLTAAALRDLDPGRSTAALSKAERARADAMFARIVATRDDRPLPAEPDRPRRMWGRRRVLLPAGLVALVAAAGIAIPTLLRGDTAYGSWTATPHPLKGDAVAMAAATCRAGLEMPDRGERVLLAEQRGEWTYVLLGGPHTEGHCVMPDDLVGERDHAKIDGNYFGGYSPDVARTHVARDKIRETESMIDKTDRGMVIMSQGVVGRDVVGVTVHTPTGLEVVASVGNGHYAAWWPAGPARGDNPELSGAWTFVVTLADGTRYETNG